MLRSKSIKGGVLRIGKNSEFFCGLGIFCGFSQPRKKSGFFEFWKKIFPRTLKILHFQPNSFFSKNSHKNTNSPEKKRYNSSLITFFLQKRPKSLNLSQTPIIPHHLTSANMQLPKLSGKSAAKT
jgi:hypothetical protein